MDDVRLRWAGTFEHLLRPGEHLVTYGVGPSDDALALVESDRASGGVGEAVSPARAALHLDAPIERVSLTNVDIRPRRVQPLPGGEILVVDTRSTRRPDGDCDLNARVYGPDGALQRELLLGDGISDVQSAIDGHIRFAYFDEGVYGHLGWGGSGDARPVGASGLVRWDIDGIREWEYQPPVGAGRIDDCYALNVAKDAVWVCYYSNWPLIRIDHADGRRLWKTPIHAARAIAVVNEGVLFHGGYRNDRDRCVLMRFDGDELVEYSRLRLLSSSGEPLNCDSVIGRGACLHVFDGPTWHVLELDSR